MVWLSVWVCGFAASSSILSIGCAGPAGGKTATIGSGALDGSHRQEDAAAAAAGLAIERWYVGGTLPPSGDPGIVAILRRAPEYCRLAADETITWQFRRASGRTQGSPGDTVISVELSSPGNAGWADEYAFYKRPLTRIWHVVWVRDAKTWNKRLYDSEVNAAHALVECVLAVRRGWGPAATEEVFRAHALDYSPDLPAMLRRYGMSYKVQAGRRGLRVTVRCRSSRKSYGYLFPSDYAGEVIVPDIRRDDAPR